MSFKKEHFYTLCGYNVQVSIGANHSQMGLKPSHSRSCGTLMFTDDLVNTDITLLKRLHLVALIRVWECYRYIMFALT